MSTPPVNSAVLPAIDRIQDPAARQAMKTLFTQLAALEAQVNGTKTLGTPDATVSAASHRLTDMADPQDPSDGMNKRTLRVIVTTLFNAALQKVGIQGSIKAQF